jgi:hypothetical protein
MSSSGSNYSQPYILSFERKWYYLLNGKKNEVGKYTRGLLDDFPNIENKLIICAQPDLKSRYFSLFDTYIEFIEYCKKVEPQHRHFYEVIFGQFAQKPHFDIDLDLEDSSGQLKMIKDNIETIFNPNDILDNTLNAIIKVLSTINLPCGGSLNINKDVLIYTSHGEKKRSYHIVITNWLHSNNKEAKEFYNLVIKEIPEEMRKYIDSSVYSIKQQFRVLGSSKFGKNRIKILNKKFTVSNVEYIHQFVTTPKNEDFEYLYSMEESFVSNSSNCLFLPNFLPDIQENKNTGGTNDLEIDNQVIRLALELLGRILNVENINNFFGLTKVNGGLIILKIKHSYNCLICKRAHESENPYLRVNHYGAVYYYCRRAGSNIMLGYIDYEVKPNDDVVTLNGIINSKLVGPVEDIRTKSLNVKQTKGTERKNGNVVNTERTEAKKILQIEEPNQNDLLKHIWSDNILEQLNSLNQTKIIKKPEKYMSTDDIMELFNESMDGNERNIIEEEDNSLIDSLWE